MNENKMADLSTSDTSEVAVATPDTDSNNGVNAPAQEPSKDNKKASDAPPNPIAWPAFIRTAPDGEIKDRFSEDVAKILASHDTDLASYCCLALLEPDSSIGTYDLDQIFNGLSELNSARDKDVLLMLLSRGGSIEPAYQISKLCKAFSHNRFVVTVPRQAKSAATLIALGADEIHMGPLGQLGPIDPQLGGLPALGVARALETIASLSEKFPGSSDMFARYLRMALTVEQIGYCDRISESAVQYAERLLSAKPNTVKNASAIARELVHEYKDHGFVIDLKEAQQHLGNDWVKSDTSEIAVSEEIYNLFDMVNLFLGIFKQKRLLVMGRLDTGIYIFDKQRD